MWDTRDALRAHRAWKGAREAVRLLSKGDVEDRVSPVMAAKPPSFARIALMRVLRDHDVPLTSVEIRALSGLNRPPQRITLLLQRMERAGLAMSVKSHDGAIRWTR